MWLQNLFPDRTVYRDHAEDCAFPYGAFVIVVSLDKARHYLRQMRLYRVPAPMIHHFVKHLYCAHVQREWLSGYYSRHEVNYLLRFQDHRNSCSALLRIPQDLLFITNATIDLLDLGG